MDAVGRKKEACTNSVETLDGGSVIEESVVVVVYLPRRATREQRANRSRRHPEDYKCGVDPGRFRVT